MLRRSPAFFGRTCPVISEPTSQLVFTRNPAWASLPLFDRKGWKRFRFGDVVEKCAETCDPAEAGIERVIAMEDQEPGSLHFRTWGQVPDGTTFNRRCRSGQILFGIRRAYQRKVVRSRSSRLSSRATSTCSHRRTRNGSCPSCRPSFACPNASFNTPSAPAPLGLAAHPLAHPRQLRVRHPAARPSAPHRENPLGGG